MRFGRMVDMKRWIWIVGMWLVGIAPALAFDLKTPEKLDFKVYWGFVRMGDARLSYVPQGDTYTLTAEVKDDSALIDLHDVWQSTGSHAERAFTPHVYHVKQAENTYRADKTMTFDKATKTVIYANRIDASDKAEPLPLTEARDALATVYAWRLGGLGDVKKAAQVPVVNVKKEVVLQRDAGVRTTLKLGNREMAVWKVRMRTVKNGKPSTDSWTVYLRDDASLQPVQIVAATKFGTFRASLDF